MKQLKLYFFDLEMESIDRVLYYSGPDSAESQVLIAQGATNFSRLRLLLNNETSANKSGYLEKVFINMNALNCEFRCRIAWQISKAYYKQTLSEVDKKNFKQANTFCQQGMQYMRIFQETSEHMKAQNRSVLHFKSE